MERFNRAGAERILVTRGATNGNYAVFAQYIPLLGTIEEDVLRCFREGGVVPYERYRRFNEVMAEDSGQTVLPALVSDILPLVPGLNAEFAVQNYYYVCRP